MIYTAILILYALSGVAICAILIACFTHTEKIEGILGEKLTECRSLKDKVKMVPPQKALIVSVVLSVFAVGVGSAVIIAWPVLLLYWG